MERYLASTQPSDLNQEEIQHLCKEIFNRQISKPIKDLKVLQLTRPFQPEYYQSESGWDILIFNTMMVFILFE